MKRSIVGIMAAAMALAASLVWYSCTKDSDEDITGTIYGTVTDYATGEPIGNANVKLRPSGETTLTGSDGTYEFKDLDAGKYSLLLSKAEYADLDDDYIIELEAGKKVKRDVQMRKEIASLQVTDMNGNPLDTLDFGTEESVTVKTFNLFNDGTESLTCTATYECDWITNVSGLESVIQPGQTKSVSVRIDRVALQDGVNTTFLYITSGNGSNEIVVKASFLGTTVITTQNATNVTASSATVGGNITDDGGRPVLERGICYGTSQSPDINGDHTQDGSGTGTFSHNITGLSSSTTYYARAYATNRNGTYYASNIVSFTTTDGLPTVTTTAVSDITATTAKSGGNITNNGGFNVTARGICWNTLGGPDLNDQHTTNGSGNGTFTSNMTGLTAGTTYYVRAYATNSQGTNYGSEKTFTTSSGSVTMTLSAATNITATSASCSVTINNDGGATITERGICWGTSQYPTSAGSHVAVGAGTGAFTASMSSLSPSTTYYVRAYAVNSAGTSYSNQISVTTTDGLPMVTTGSVSNITATTATCGGNVTSDGGFTVTAKGLCWSTAQYPTVTGSHSNDGSGTGAFNGSLTNLQIGTTYYVRAYASNSTGTSYGEQVSFTTGNGLPTVTTTTPTLSDTTVITGGNVTSDGGYAVTARGICYGTFPNPDLTNTYNHTSNGSGTGYYSSSFSLPVGSGIYYIRAYATNANGTSYGEQVTIAHPYDTLPTFTHNGHTYKVAPQSPSYSYWAPANTYCNSLTYLGYTDWRLPTRDELLQMYVDGIISTDRFWSSTTCTESGHNGHIIVYGGINYFCSYDYAYTTYARPIRMDN